MGKEPAIAKDQRHSDRRIENGGDDFGDLSGIDQHRCRVQHEDRKGDRALIFVIERWR